MLHSALSSDFGQFWYIDNFIPGQGEAQVLGGSCSKCKLLKVRIVEEMSQQVLIDFLLYDLATPVIPRGIISDNARELIGTEVRKAIKKLNQGLKKFKFIELMGNNFIVEYEGTKREEDFAEEERFRRKQNDRKKYK